MIDGFVRQLGFGKLRLLILIGAASTVFSAGCTPEQASGIASTLAGDIMRQLVAWWLL